MKKGILILFLVLVIAATVGVTLFFVLNDGKNNETSGGTQGGSQGGTQGVQGGTQGGSQGSSGGTDEKHTHSYRKKVAEEKFLKTAATCTSQALYYYSCECGEAGTTTFQSGAYAEHSFGQLTNEVPPTCTEKGVMAYRECSECHKRIDADGESVLNTSLNMLPHTFGTLNDEVPATCYNDGVKEYKDCSVCLKHFDKRDNEIEDLVIKSTGHELGNMILRVPATCSTNGVLPHADCEFCHKHFDNLGNELTNLTIPKLGHTLGAPIAAVSPTCTEKGEVSHKDCLTCGEHFDLSDNPLADISVDFLPHTFGAIHPIIDSTCVAQGRKEYKDCTVCLNHFDKDDAKIDDLVIDYKAHTYGTMQAEVPSTCTVAGTLAHKDCKVCLKHFDDDNNEMMDITLPKIAHTFEAVTPGVAPTCTTAGTMAYKNCSECHGKFNEDGGEITNIALPAKGHDYKAGTCKICSAEQPAGNLTYTYNSVDDAYTVTDWLYYSDNGTSVCIPLTYNGKPVTKIAANAFKGTPLTEIITSDNITQIEDDAFLECTSLTDVYLGANVQNLTVNAFTGCNPLKCINVAAASVYYESPDNKALIEKNTNTLVMGTAHYVVPDGVTAIGAEAFKGFKDITDINIPRSVTTIGDYAFDGCKSLKSINLFNNLTDIGKGVFHGCDGLEELKIESGGKYTDKDSNGNAVNCLIDSLTKTVVTGCNKSVIPTDGSVTAIDESAFKDCKSLKNITLANCMTTIGAQAFEGCSSLMIYCEASAKPAGWDANWNFSGCPVVWNYKTSSSLEDGSTLVEIDNLRYYVNGGKATVGNQSLTTSGKITIRDKVMLGGTDYPVEGITDGAFQDCTEITTVNIPEGITYIGERAFMGCTRLIKSTLPESLKSIGTLAFKGCERLSTVIIPVGVVTIGNQAFQESTAFTKLTHRPSGWDSDWGYPHVEVVWDCDNTDTTAFDHTYVIDNGILYSVLEDTYASVAAIAEDSEDVEIPETINYKGKNLPVKTSYGDAFKDCISLKSISFPKNFDYINTSMFEGCTSLSVVNFSEGLTRILSNAFYGCKAITSIDLPKSLLSVGKDAFSGCNGILKAEDGVQYVSTWAISAQKDLSDLTIKDKTLGIAEGAFKGSSMSTISLPTSLLSIDKEAFKDCKFLMDIKIPSTVKHVGLNAFSGASYLNQTVHGITYVDTWAVAFDDSATDLVIRDGTLGISTQETSTNNNVLKSIELPFGIKYIGDNAFKRKAALKTVSFPFTVVEIGNDAFAYCTQLTEMTIPLNVSTLNHGLFVNCENLTNVKLHDDITEFKDELFLGCLSLKSITLPKNLNIMWERTFYNCPSLTDIFYKGTAAEWNALPKGYDWYDPRCSITVHCTDGDLDCNGNPL